MPVIFTDYVNEGVLWRIELEPVHRCNHVNLLTATHVPDELEFLFSVEDFATLQWLGDREKHLPRRAGEAVRAEAEGTIPLLCGGWR